MTVEEHLWFYAKIKGIPQAVRQSVVEKSILEMSLEEHRTKTAGSLSGGNKRKLSVAIATLGNPPIILLDEPSAGMDPEARRFMWTVVAKISQRDKKSAVILTTHSMEEAEALSTKMGIMVRGGYFRCFGSSQHIKNKYGTGYELEIKIKKPTFEQLKRLCDDYHYDFTSLDDFVCPKPVLLRFAQHGVNHIILEQVRVGGIGADIALEAL